MKVNTGRIYLLVFRNVRATTNIDKNYSESGKEQALLGITIDTNLPFENQTNNICKIACQKMNALAGVSSYKNIQKRRITMKSFVTSQLGYCLLNWMFHSRHLHKQTSSIHERALRITYQDHISTFKELINKDNSVSMHHRNLQVLPLEMFKIGMGLSPDILREIFVPKITSYNLRRISTFERRQVHSVYHGSESLSFLSPKIGDFVPLELN